MQWSLTEPDTLFEPLLQDLPTETSHAHIPPDAMAECLSTQRKGFAIVGAQFGRVAGDGAVILDTCALRWLAQGGGALSERALQRIDAAPIVDVSAISGFAIGIKVRKGKLHLPVPPADWFTAVLTQQHLEVLGLTLEVCLRSTTFPLFHADPYDRMIIAAAQVYHLPVVSTDPLCTSYDIEVLA